MFAGVSVVPSTQDCIHLCMSVTQAEFPELGALAPNVNSNDKFLLRILLTGLEGKISESDLKAHSEQRRSYSMEHFRWGKPSGRKRRPVKVFASSLEGGGSSEGSFSPQARRQLTSNEDNAKGDLNGESQQNSLRARASSKSHVKLGQQQRKDGTYRMSHFRWGSPPPSKRNGNFMKTWEKKPQKQLTKLFRNIIVEDVQRIMG